MSPDHRAALKKASTLQRHIETIMGTFDDRLSPKEQADPYFAYRVAFIQKMVKRASAADEAIEFVKPGSDEDVEINRFLLNEVEKTKYLPSKIARIIKYENYGLFTINKHTDIWKILNAKDPTKPYGTQIVNQWY